MERYTRIQSVMFGSVELPLPISVRISRRAEGLAAAGDADEFATSVQLGQLVVAAEVRIRGTAAAEGLSPGQQGALSFTVVPARSGAHSRTISLDVAVLTAVEIEYEQASAASATLKFVAEAADGGTNPFSAEDSQ